MLIDSIKQRVKNITARNISIERMSDLKDEIEIAVMKYNPERKKHEIIQYNQEK